MARGTVPKFQCATSDRHFTVLGFTAATGDPILCVILLIGEGDSVPGLWTSGIDITVEPELDEEGIPAVNTTNCGPGKYYPNGPTCMFKGKKVP